MRQKRTYHYYRNKRTGETYGTGSNSGVTYRKKHRIFGKRVAKRQGYYYITQKPKAYR